ncbi:MAG: polysulfide reductase NrfD [Planctomycetaceae bacterium]|nr:polysulfide reductase NrfD [Planctomycetaceae bacterium]
MSHPVYSPLREPLVYGNKSLGQVTTDVCGVLERKPSKEWWLGFMAATSILGLGALCVAYQIGTGIGTWGLNRTVGWAFDITNFVFWIGIGHAGTLISAVLFLLRQKWRTSINRSAEAMTLFAVACAGLFPLIHMGRPWLGYWVFPYPNFRGPVWPNFRSPLLWDVFAISTYGTISAVFWYVGLIPDLATIRDRAKTTMRKAIYGFLAMGWNGSAKAWRHYEVTYLILAGLATPLVFSVHSIVSMDFATSVIPGWHTTIFPPYFVAGAIFSGFAMVLTLLLITRKVLHYEDYITVDHIDKMCKVTLVFGSLVGLAYGTEFLIAWYSGSQYEGYTFINRATGPFGWTYWVMVSCNVIAPQFFWFRKFRRHIPLIFVLSLVINVGMWFERFVIILTSLHRDYLPSSWSLYYPTLIEVLTLLGSFGLFFTLFLVFVRVLPPIAFGEVKGVMSYARSQKHSHRHEAAKHVGAGAHH